MSTVQTLFVVAAITLIPTVSLLGILLNQKKAEKRVKVPIRIENRRNRR